MGTPTWRGPTDQLLEMPDSPTYDSSRNGSTCARVYMGLYSLALAGKLPAETIGTGDMTGWLVQSSRVQRQRGGIGKLTVVYGGGGTAGAASGEQLPPDRFGCTPFEVNPPLERNNRYSSLTDENFAAVDACIRVFQKDTRTPVPLTGLLLDLFNKKKRGTTNYYLAGFKYEWTVSNYNVSGTLSVGGFLQTPYGPLGSFIPGSFSCLRQADDLKWTGKLYEYTRSWLCAPDGHFDSDLY